jgi:hypothetical protein
MSTSSGAPFSFTLPEDSDLADLVGVFLKPALQTLNTYGVHTTATQTLTNKTLTSPTLTNPVIGVIVVGSTSYTLPTTDGTSGQVLSTNGSGTLSWTAGSSGTSSSTYRNSFLLMGA